LICKQAYHVGGLRAVTTSVSRLVTVAADGHSLVSAVSLSVAFFVAVTAGIGGL
jgi:hypothetical protein